MNQPKGYAEWKAMRELAIRKDWTFKQACYHFFARYGYWPADNMPLLPPKRALSAWARLVADVPREQLNEDPWADDGLWEGT